MSTQGSGPVQKACLLTLFQVVIIFLGFALISINNSFDQTAHLQLKCMTVSDAHKMCISVFEKDPLKIPSSSNVQLASLHRNPFKVLEFQQNPNRLKNVYKNEFQEYFYLVNFNTEIKQIQNIQMDTEVWEINQFLKIQSAKFSSHSFNKTSLSPLTGFAVIYVLVQNRGPIVVPDPQINATFSTFQSVYLNSKICILSCLVGIILILAWTGFQISNSNRPANESFCQNPQVSKINRPIQFLLYFGMSNLIFYLSKNHLLIHYELDGLDQWFGIDLSTTPISKDNVQMANISLFPEWMILGYFIYLVGEKYCSWSNFKLVIFSALFSGILYIVPSCSPQVLFELAVVVLGLSLIVITKSPNNKSSKLTIPMVFTAFNLCLMMIIKMRWISYQDEFSDFMLRFLYTHVFVVSNILSLFYNEDQISAKSDRKYIPYEEYSMQQEHEFEDQEHVVPSAEKM